MDEVLNEKADKIFSLNVSNLNQSNYKQQNTIQK